MLLTRLFSASLPGCRWSPSSCVLTWHFLCESMNRKRSIYHY
jgi:hypothetical protein